MTTTPNRLPIGATSMMFWDRTVERALPLAAELGYDVVEVWAEHLWREDEDPRLVASLLEKEGLRCTVHCPIMDLNITSLNRGIREESLRQMLQSVELSHDLGAELLIVHPGRLSSTRGSLNTSWAMQLEALEQIVTYAQRRSVRLAVENMDTHSKVEVVKSHQDIRRITTHFVNEELGVVLDTTHLGSTERVLEFIAGLDNIVHTHLSDARRTPTGAMRTHLPLGEGEIDFQRVLAALLPRYDGVLSLETFIAPGNPDQVLAQRLKVEAIVDTL